ncbi:MAG TPA: MBL fold metallo-hydrolase [Candidatus Binatia bacterium]|nr:MBL fold metallo-hydrolase [Candidatus Binatia bacterium]
MTTVDEIAPKTYRLSTYVPEIRFQFAQFVVDDDEPVLLHTGMRVLFPQVRDAVARVLDPARVRWIGFSHFEADECGALNEWLALAPAATPVCSVVGALVSVNDFALRPARGMQDGETLATGACRFRFLRTPHVPHGWEAGLLFEETGRTLFCSDLFHQNGDVEATTTADLAGRARDTLVSYEGGPFARYLPYTPYTDETLQRLAALAPARIAPMHGSTFIGDGARALRDLAVVFRDVLGPAK